MWRKLLNRISVFKRSDSGVQLVELAIVLPILLMMFAAVAEFGRYFYEYTTLAKSSRDAVRYLATAYTDGRDDAAAKSLVVYGNLTGAGNPILSGLTTANVEILRLKQNGSPAGCIPFSVTIRIIDFKHASVLKLDKLTNSSSLDIDVKPSVTMRYLMSQCLV
jgi:hypothetical protein